MGYWTEEEETGSSVIITAFDIEDSAFCLAEQPLSDREPVRRSAGSLAQGRQDQLPPHGVNSKIFFAGQFATRESRCECNSCQRQTPRKVGHDASVKSTSYRFLFFVSGSYGTAEFFCQSFPYLHHLYIFQRPRLIHSADRTHQCNRGIHAVWKRCADESPDFSRCWCYRGERGWRRWSACSCMTSSITCFHGCSVFSIVISLQFSPSSPRFVFGRTAASYWDYLISSTPAWAAHLPG